MYKYIFIENKFPIKILWKQGTKQRNETSNSVELSLFLYSCQMLKQCYQSLSLPSVELYFQTEWPHDPKGPENMQTVPRPRGYKTFFMLNSVEHGIFPAHKY